MKGQQSSCESLLPTLLLPHPINPVRQIIIVTILFIVDLHIEVIAEISSSLFYRDDVIKTMAARGLVNGRDGR